MRKKTAVYALLTHALFLTACAEVNEDDAAGQTDPSRDTTAVSSTASSEEKEGNTDSTMEDTETEDLKNDILNPSSTAVLANKQYHLDEVYVPEDLVTVNVPTVLENPEVKQLRKEAADALETMFAAAEEEGVLLYARSGYRSYQTQVQLFQNYVSRHGEEAANRYSARPGESEHQTGLAMDVTSESVDFQLTEEFGETPEGTWIKEHAHHYGFIIRYPEGKEAVTGYIYEPWHLRYLGEKLAEEVYESGLTYEEYLKERGIEIEINH